AQHAAAGIGGVLRGVAGEADHARGGVAERVDAAVKHVADDVEGAFDVVAVGEFVGDRLGNAVDGLAGIAAHVVVEVDALASEVAELVEVEFAKVFQRVAAGVAGEADHRLGDVAGQVQPAVDQAAQGRVAAGGEQAAEEVAGAVEAVVGRSTGAFGQG